VAKERYHHFKLLLGVNIKILEGLSQIEAALNGSVPFGMTFVRSQVTRVAANVYQVIKHLTEIAPGRYDLLHGQFGRCL